MVGFKNGSPKFNKTEFAYKDGVIQSDNVAVEERANGERVILAGTKGFIRAEIEKAGFVWQSDMKKHLEELIKEQHDRTPCDVGDKADIIELEANGKIDWLLRNQC
jgi:hypothetical protein